MTEPVYTPISTIALRELCQELQSCDNETIDDLYQSTYSIFEHLASDGLESCQDLPSWLPHWSQNSTMPLFDTNLYCTGGRRSSDGDSETTKICISEDKQSIMLPMIIVDQVVHLVSPFEQFRASYRDKVEHSSRSDKAELLSDPAALDKAAKAQRYSQILLAAVSQGRDLSTARPADGESLYSELIEGDYVTGQSKLEAFWRTLVCDIDAYGRRAKRKMGDGLEVYNAFKSASSHIYDVYEACQVSDSDEVLRLFTEAYERYGDSRSFVVGRNGYVGWAPPGTEPEDLICIVPGLRTPYVFREMNGTKALEMIGHAYIHGLMDEMIDSSKGELTSKAQEIAPTWLSQDLQQKVIGSHLTSRASGI